MVGAVVIAIGTSLTKVDSVCVFFAKKFALILASLFVFGSVVVFFPELVTDTPVRAVTLFAIGGNIAVSEDKDTIRPGLIPVATHVVSSVKDSSIGGCIVMGEVTNVSDGMISCNVSMQSLTDALSLCNGVLSLLIGTVLTMTGTISSLIATEFI